MNPLNNLNIHIDIIDKRQVGPDWSKKRFPYPHHRIYYVTGGEATLLLNDSMHMLKPGHIYLLPAFSMVETVCNDFLTHHYIHFRLQNSEVLDIFSVYQPKIELEASENVPDIFSVLNQHYNDDSPYGIMMTTSSMYALLAPFFRDGVNPSADLLRFEPVLNYIDANLASKLTNEALASLLELNPVYFSNLFTQVFTLSPHQYIIQRRLEKAQTLLTSTDLKIKDIAEQLGFENNMYFSYLFKKKLDTTPSLYRKTLR